MQLKYCCEINKVSRNEKNQKLELWRLIELKINS